MLSQSEKILGGAGRAGPPSFGAHLPALGSAFEHAPVAQIAVALRGGGLLAASRKARVLLDISDTAEIVVGADRFFSEHDRLHQLLAATERGEQVSERELRIRTLSGDCFWARIDTSRLDDMMLIAIQDIGAYKNEKETLKDLAERDSLTDLPNRRAYKLYAERVIARSLVLGDEVCLAIFDVDFFKQVNDEHGHPTGDRVLQTISHVAKETLRRTDFVARYGGEEFVILMPGTPAVEAQKVLERLRERLASMAIPSVRKNDVHITVSIGMSELLAQDSEINLIERADRALYRAKTNGRNRVEVG